MLLTVSDKNQGINTDKDFLNDYILCKSTESQKSLYFHEKKRFCEKTDSQQNTSNCMKTNFKKKLTNMQ